MIIVNRNPTPHDIRQFGWAMLGGFTFLALLAWIAAWRGGAPFAAWAGSGGQIAAVVLVSLGILLFALARRAPAVAKRVYVLWMTAALAIGCVVSAIPLTLMFVLVLPIFSFIVRMCDPLRKKGGGAESYWEDYKPHEPTLDRMRRLF